jgi:hypothetical protein
MPVHSCAGARIRKRLAVECVPAKVLHYAASSLTFAQASALQGWTRNASTLPCQWTAGATGDYQWLLTYLFCGCGCLSVCLSIDRLRLAPTTTLQTTNMWFAIAFLSIRPPVCGISSLVYHPSQKEVILNINEYLERPEHLCYVVYMQTLKPQSPAINPGFVKNITVNAPAESK